MKGRKMSQRIIKLPRLTAATSAVWLSLHVCVPLQINLQIRKNPLYFLFSTTPASPRKAASIIGSCLHQLRSCEQLILPSQLPDPKCIMQKDPSCWGWSIRTWASRLDCSATRYQSKSQLVLWLCRDQCNEQRAVVIFLQQSEPPEAR